MEYHGMHICTYSDILISKGQFVPFQIEEKDDFGVIYICTYHPNPSTPHTTFRFFCLLTFPL